MAPKRRETKEVSPTFVCDFGLGTLAQGAVKQEQSQTRVTSMAASAPACKLQESPVDRVLSEVFPKQDECGGVLEPGRW